MTAIITWATALLTALVGGTAAAGVFGGATYPHETASWAAQGKGQDAADLLIALPCLIASAVFAIRGSLRALLIWLGIDLYFIYSYVIYAFFLHFGPLFPAYVATLGVSFYSFALAWRAVDRGKAAAELGPRTPVRFAGGLLLVFASGFAWLWLSEIVPNVIAGTAPRSLAEAGLAVNPVHVLDLAFALPAMALAGILLLKRRPMGYLLAGVMLSFSAAMGAAILGMNVSMLRKGLLGSLSAAIPMGAVTALSGIALWRLLRRPEISPPPAG
jgi:hypothetical protein